VVADRAAALEFGTRHEARFLEDFRSGRRELTLAAYETQIETMDRAKGDAWTSARAVQWLLGLGVLGFLLTSRETWRFRVAALATIVVFEIGQLMFGSVY